MGAGAGVALGLGVGGINCVTLSAGNPEACGFGLLGFALVGAYLGQTGGGIGGGALGQRLGAGHSAGEVAAWVALGTGIGHVVFLGANLFVLTTDLPGAVDVTVYAIALLGGLAMPVLGGSTAPSGSAGRRSPWRRGSTTTGAAS